MSIEPFGGKSSPSNSPWDSSTPAATQQMGAQQVAEAERLAKPNVLDILKGAFVGIIAAVICAIVWDKLTYYTGWQIGYVAIGIGFVIGMAVLFGANQKRGISLQILSGLLSLFGILLGEALLLMDGIRDQIAGGQIPGAASLSSLEVFLISVRVLPEALGESPMSFLFMALGVWYAFAIPGAEKEAAPAQEEPYVTDADATDAAAPAPAAAASTPVADTVKAQSLPFDAPPR